MPERTSLQTRRNAPKSRAATRGVPPESPAGRRQPESLKSGPESSRPPNRGGRPGDGGHVAIRQPFWRNAGDQRLSPNSQRRCVRCTARLPAVLLGSTVQRVCRVYVHPIFGPQTSARGTCVSTVISGGPKMQEPNGSGRSAEIAQAQGRVSVQADCTVDEALLLMRARAASGDLSLAYIVAAVLEGTIRFDDD